MRIAKIIMWGAAAAAAAGVSPAAAAPVSPNLQADGRALILVPLALTKIDDLDFGTVVTSATSGSVVINATTGARSVSGGVTALASDPGQRAYFGGAGSPNQQVVVTVNSPAQLVSPAGDTIEVVTLTLQGSPMKTIDPVTRAFFFGVGGVITVGANQPEGVYEATFDVTANYL